MQARIKIKFSFRKIRGGHFGYGIHNFLSAAREGHIRSLIHNFYAHCERTVFIDTAQILAGADYRIPYTSAHPGIGGTPLHVYVESRFPGDIHILLCRCQIFAEKKSQPIIQIIRYGIEFEIHFDRQ